MQKDKEYYNKIEDLISNSMKNLKSMVDIDVVIGKPIVSTDDLTIIPLTKLVMGYIAGGGEYYSELKDAKKDTEYPFSGGTGGGFNLQPIGFLVIKNACVEIVRMNEKNALEKLVEAVPEVIKFIEKNFSKDKNNE